MSGRYDTPWDDDRTERLKELFFSGLTARQIAEALPIEGLTKSAVIGKLYRLGLSKKKEEPTKLVSLYVCQYPFGHPGEPGFHFCGKPVDPQRSYCDEHHQLCHRKLEVVD